MSANTRPESEKSRRALFSFQSFFQTPLDEMLARCGRERPEEAVLRLFHSAAREIHAYGDFLKNHGIDASSIQTIEDFKKLPPVSKKNYIQRYALGELCRGSDLSGCDMIAVSSGSTGTPTFWPRFVSDELQIAARFEQIFHDSFEADRRRTLSVVCFALGTWVGGMYSAALCRHVAAKGYPITVITPGNNKDEILRVLAALGQSFEQVVLLGYPPFLKDLIDLGTANGVDWGIYRIKLVLAGEVISEAWRSLLGERTKGTRPCYDSASLYGTADAGVLGNETPLSIAIRRFLSEHPEHGRELFGASRMPTLVQYDPMSRYFECIDNTLLFSGDNGIPLIRYNIHDTGGVITYDEMMSFLRARGYDPAAELGASARGVRELPFVYVFGRNDFTISYFGANIYPENITVGLEEAPICNWVTGKFVLESREDADQNPYLSIVVELVPGVEGDSGMAEAIARSVEKHLHRLNSEYVHYVPAERRRPLITLAKSADPVHFPAGVKHRYTRR